MGACSFLHKDKSGVPKSILTANIPHGCKIYSVSFPEKHFLSLLFKELCIRNNSKLNIEKSIFLLLLPFKGLFGESLFENFRNGEDWLMDEKNFLRLFEKFLSSEFDGVTEEIFKICNLENNTQLSIEDFTLTLSDTIQEIITDKNLNLLIRGLGRGNANLNGMEETKGTEYESKEIIRMFFDQSNGKLGKIEFIQLLNDKKIIIDKVREKFRKSLLNIETFLDKYKNPGSSEMFKCKVFAHGKIVGKYLAVNKKFLLLFDKKFNLDNVFLLPGCCIKTVGSTLLLFYLTHFEERITFLFDAGKDCELLALRINQVIKPRKIQDFFRIGKKIGFGRFSEVFEASELLTGEKFAVKIMKKKNLNQNEREIMQNEVNMLASLKHEGIVYLKDVFEGRKKLMIVMELVDGNDLLKKIENQPVAEDEIKKNVFKILEILKYLHSAGIMHRDIKPENIMVVDDGNDVRFKVIDFGLSAYFKLKSFRKVSCGTIFYTAPEVFSENYNEKSDLWSLGVLAYTYFSGKYPFFGQSKEEIAKLIENNEPLFDSDGWACYSEEAKDFCRSLLAKDPSSRPSCEQAQKHIWFHSASAQRIID